MTVRTSQEAIAAALAQDRNVLGTCQSTVRGWFAAPSVGDVDGDGDADAVDGWESEPKAYRHPGDRNPPPGVPLSFEGGSRGFGHRAMSLAHKGHIRSTDMNGNTYSPTFTSTVSSETTSAAIAVLEQQMNQRYLGWSETIDGQLIPNFAQKPGPAPTPQTRGARVDRALRNLRQAKAIAEHNHRWARAKSLGVSIRALRALPTHDRKPQKH
jgi:hypothetical protein